jgi:hypothetical protein
MGNKFFETLVELKYVEKTLPNDVYFLEEVTNRLISTKVRYHSVNSILSSNFISKITQIKIKKNIQFLLLFYMGVKLGLSH